jgi:hypothetical protein
MPKDERSFSRRNLLKSAVAGTAAGLGGIYLSRRSALRDRLVEESKGVAESVRRFPGFGYGGNPVHLADIVGASPVLEADRDQPGYWKGAPALEHDAENGRLLTHVRHRDPKHRGYLVSISQVDHETLNLDELIAIPKQDLNARSMEGGELIVEDGKFRWFLSYQHAASGDWRIQERRASTIEGMQSGGTDLDIDSQYTHHKDPTAINEVLYFLSSSKNWLWSQPEKVALDGERKVATGLTVRGVGNARITGGGLLDGEIFADTWPDFPGTNTSNVLWTTDERNATGFLDSDTVHIPSGEYFISRSDGSVTYVDAEIVGETVYLLWQAEQSDGSKDLVGGKLGVEEYSRIFTPS